MKILNGDKEQSNIGIRKGIEIHISFMLGLVTDGELITSSGCRMRRITNGQNWRKLDKLLLNFIKICFKPEVPLGLMNVWRGWSHGSCQL